MINIEPTQGHPIPYDTDTEKPKTFKDSVTVSANTADILKDMGAPIEVSQADFDETINLIKNTRQDKKLSQPSNALAASMFLKSYANQLAIDAVEVRSAMTTKLIELCNCGDPRFELKAIELLGKHSDIGIFTERSEITINHKTSSSLEDAIKEKVKRLLNAEIVDITPIMDSLDEELDVIEEKEDEQLDVVEEKEDEELDVIEEKEDEELDVIEEKEDEQLDVVEKKEDEELNVIEELDVIEEKDEHPSNK